MTKGVFELQLRFYKNHCLTLIDSLYQGKEVAIKNQYDLDEVFEKHLPDFVSRLGIYYKEKVRESTI